MSNDSLEEENRNGTWIRSCNIRNCITKGDILR